jgi:hypothetical protein
MGKSFKTAVAFRTSLEERLRQTAKEQSFPLVSLRLKVVIERLLARLFVQSDPPWLLKGGYAMELRYRPKARTTKDIDLAAKSRSAELSARLRQFRDELQSAGDQDCGDFFVFEFAKPTRELQGAPGGGARFPVTALVAAKAYAKFHLDVGFGDPSFALPDELVGQDFLAFAGIPPARVLAIPKAQQFAEKLHAYTFPWNDRPNTRVKDLVDLVLLATRDPPNRELVKEAVRITFDVRKSHALPSELDPPPAE